MSQIESLFPGAVKKFVKASGKYPRDYKFTAKAVDVMDMEGTAIEIEILVAASRVNPNEQFLYSNETGNWKKTSPREHQRGQTIASENLKRIVEAKMLLEFGASGGEFDLPPLSPTRQINALRREGKTIKITVGELREAIANVILESGLSDEEEAQVNEKMSEEQYQSIDAFAEYLAGEDMHEFNHLDLQALYRNLNDAGTPTSIQQVKAALVDWGFKFGARAIPKQVRGFTANSHDRWHGKGSAATHGGAGIDASTGRATVRGRTV